MDFIGDRVRITSGMHRGTRGRVTHIAYRIVRAGGVIRRYETRLRILLDTGARVTRRSSTGYVTTSARQGNG